MTVQHGAAAATPPRAPSKKENAMKKRANEALAFGDKDTIPAALVVAVMLFTFGATIVSVETEARNAFVKEAVVAAAAPVAHE